MFTANQDVMSASCTAFGQQPNSVEETQAIHDAVASIAGTSGADARYIFATVMQESSGCVRVVGTTPCPESSISGMISDGTAGADGLREVLARAGSSDAQAVYKAARINNFGSLDAFGDLATNTATPYYSSDIANRLTGFVGTSECTLTR